jgi:hypothetical protein
VARQAGRTVGVSPGTKILNDKLFTSSRVDGAKLEFDSTFSFFFLSVVLCFNRLT